MEYIPHELLALITHKVSHADKAMLSLTCKALRQTLPQKNTVLDCCVYDGTLEQVRLAESWGNSWTDATYYQLGCSGNVELAEYRCMMKTWVFRQFNLCDTHAEEIYNGACRKGQRLLLEWLYTNYKPRAHLDGDWSCRGPELAACGHHYELLDEFVQHEAKSVSAVWEVAGRLLDLDLVRYCLRKQIKSSSFLERVVQAKKSLTEVKVFLDACKHEGVKYNQFSLFDCKPPFELSLMFVSYGVKYVSSCGTVSVAKNAFAKDNVGKVDWNSGRQKHYLFDVITARYKSKDWQAICCIKAFMKEELRFGRDGIEVAYAEFCDLHRTEKSKMLATFLT